uniref:Uncharacterized protein n=1 Tax=Oryza barthii TaxID=65489 RepID=A0A0D3HKL3_9ORYZ
MLLFCLSSDLLITFVHIDIISLFKRKLNLDSVVHWDLVATELLNTNHECLCMKSIMSFVDSYGWPEDIIRRPCLWEKNIGRAFIG